MAEIPPPLRDALARRYRVEMLVGEGATARVYRAVDLRHDRTVALKVLRPEVAAAVGAERFLAEIRTTARLEHPHILPLFDSGEAAGALYYVMPFIEGASLRDHLDRNGPLALDDATRIARDVASALDHAHGRGVIHRDVKPANVLLGEGGARVSDFGLALALADVPRERLTATGVSVGTPHYMSPEQIEGSAEVDGRSDVYALGCLVFEMLTGRAPFEGTSLQAVLAQALTAPPPRASELRADLPDAVSKAVVRALEKDPERRYSRAGDFAAELAGAGRPVAASLGRSRPWIVGTLALVALLVAGGVVAWRAVERASARAALPEIGRLVSEERYGEAYRAALEAQRWLPDDPAVQRALAQSSDLVTVRTDPPGATVLLQRADPGTPPAPELLGRAPIVDHTVPRGEYRLTAELDGHATMERMVSTTIQREGRAPEEGRRYEVDLHFTPLERLPADMTEVPGGPYTLTSPGAPSDVTADLRPFFIDRHEITHREFAAFVEAGGYGLEEIWSGVPLGLRASFVDQTGLPAPRRWRGQRYPDGLDDHPVTGVTWYEAQAYCRWVEKRLPTIHEWEKTARDGGVSAIGVRMPWGIVRSAAAADLPANFSSDGTVAVDAHPFGISPWGAYAMAGNVREWLANPSGAGRAAAGGSWASPAYVWSQYTVEDAGYAAPDLGLRCARSASDGAAEVEEVPAVVLTPPVTTYTPVDRATWESYLGYYRYDPVPPRPRLADRTEAAAWTRERLWIDGLEGDSILVYAWTPRAASAPAQTVVYLGSSSTFLGMMTVPEETEWVVGPLVRAGRAVVAPVLSGMSERPFPSGFEPPDPATVGFRELLVRHATELRLVVDYLETRPDLDTDALAYAAFSFGAGSRLGLSGVDDRFDAAIYIGGGIDERMKPVLPEADNVNFAPYVDVPKLLLNGANDEEHPWPTRGRALWELLREPKTLVLVEGAGHLPPLEARIPAMNDFLDGVLGPVRR